MRSPCNLLEIQASLEISLTSIYTIHGEDLATDKLQGANGLYLAQHIYRPIDFIGKRTKISLHYSYILNSPWEILYIYIRFIISTMNDNIKKSVFMRRLL